MASHVRRHGVATIAFLYQQSENFALVPRVTRRAVAVSPAATIVVSLVGGALAGVAGGTAGPPDGGGHPARLQ